jgi:ABC-2 type transport system permease protein
MSASLFDSNIFWFYMTLESGDQVLEIPLPENLDKEGLQRSLDAGLKRFVTDINKTVAVSSPATMPTMPQYNLPPQGPQFNILRDVLSQEHVVIEADLSSGQLPTETDLLVVLAPDDIDDKELFAIDQFLMRGGTVIISSSPHSINLEGALKLSPATSGIEEWLMHHGVSIGKELVLDKQNSPFPIPMERNIGGLTIQETHLVKYPFFIDIRNDGMNTESGLLSSINQMTMNWASPIRVEDETNNKIKVTSLLTSSPESWLITDTNIQPNFKAYGELGFEVGEEMGSQVLGVVIEGSFSSFFEGKPSPLSMAGEQEDQNEEPETAESEKEEAKQVVLRQIDKSPPSSRIILFSSNSFLSDAILSISSSVRRTGALEPVQMIANAVDWSLEDRGLLTLRGRSHFSRPLIPMTRDQQLFWEYLNYGLMLAGLILVWFIKSLFNQQTRQRQLAILQESVGRI